MNREDEIREVYYKLLLYKGRSAVVFFCFCLEDIFVVGRFD